MVKATTPDIVKLRVMHLCPVSLLWSHKLNQSRPGGESLDAAASDEVNRFL